MDVRPVVDEDRPWLRELIAAEWGLPVVSISGCHDPSTLPGFVAWIDAERVGVVTFRVTDDGCEVVTLDGLRQRRGVGSALLAATCHVARAQGMRLWLITTNDNVAAIRFYQRRGLDMCRLHRDFADVIRVAKPGFNDVGQDGIVIRHALEFTSR